MKNIYIFDEYLSSKQNGVGSYMRQLLNCLAGLKDTRLNVVYFNYDESKEFCIQTNNGITYYCFPPLADKYFFNYAPVYSSILKLHIKDSRENLFMLNHSPCEKILRSLKRNFPRSKFTFAIHDQGWAAPLNGDREALRKLITQKRLPTANRDKLKFIRDYYHEEKRMYRLVDAVICLTEEFREFVHEFYDVPKEKLYAICNAWQQRTNNCIQTRNELRRELGLYENEKIIVFTGRQHPVKGLYQLFQAFENVYQKERNIRLVIIGKNPNIEEYTKLMPTALSRVIFTGYIKQSNIVDWYRAADIGILPSYNEQCSYSGIEMLMLGMLVISTDSQGLTDMFHDNENALVAKIGNRKDDKEFIASLTETILKALRLPQEKVEELSANAKTYAQEKYSLSQMREKYIALIENIYKQ